MKEKINLLEVIPLRKSHITTEWEDDCAVIVFPRFKRAWIQRLLLPKSMSPYIRVRLEDKGTAVWNLIDGENTVNDIIEKLADQFKDEVGYESRIITFIGQLQKDGFITYGLRVQS